MKKLLSLTLIFSLLCFAGCGFIEKDPTEPPHTSDPDTSTSAPSESTQPTEVLPQTQQLPMVSVSLPLSREEYTADDGTVLLSVTRQNVYTPILQDADVAEAVALDLMNRIDSVTASASDLLSQAKADYTGQSNWTPYLCQVIYDPMRIDSGVLSLFGHTVTYSGGIHPDTASVSVTYDLVTGSVLSLGDLLTEGSTPEDLARLATEALSQSGYSGSLYSDYADSVAARFSGSWERDTGWYLSREGLVFYFSPYDIAPYAVGTVVAQISYENLTGILKDAWFPTERVSTSGAIEAVLFDAADLEQFTQFSEVILDTDGTRFLLHTDGSVYDLRLEQGQWSAEGDSFTPTAVVFACESLTPGDAVMVQSMFSDVPPSLRLTYRSGEEEITAYLYQSGEDGSILLGDN